jgi:hypothetical protein
MKKQKGVLFRVETDVFPAYHMKRIGEEDTKLLYIDGWSYCAIAKRDHAIEKQGKVYFIINNIEVKQKCHSDKCKGVFAPVYTIEAERQRKAEANKIALAIIRKRRRDEAKAYEEEHEKFLNGRSVSPDGRSSSQMYVSTKYLPKYTETETKEEPTQITQIPLPWFRYRYFEDRMQCKTYYLNQFGNQEHLELPIYPIVIEIQSSQLLDADYVTLHVEKLARYHATREKYQNYWFYIVLYNKQLKKSAEWGFMATRRLLMKKDNPNYHIIFRNHCKPGITYTQCIEFFKQLQRIPGEIAMETNMNAEGKEQAEMHFYEQEVDYDEALMIQRVIQNVKINPYYLIRFHTQYVTKEKYQDFIETTHICSKIQAEQQELEKSMQDIVQ